MILLFAFKLSFQPQRIQNDNSHQHYRECVNGFFSRLSFSVLPDFFNRKFVKKIAQKEISTNYCLELVI